METPYFEIPCVILCGGKSSRMGEDKALLPFSNYPTLSQFQYERLKPFFKEIYLSSKTDKFNFEKNLILDKENIHSPMVALKNIFETLKNEDKIFIITVDTPFVKIETIEKIINNSQEYSITVAKTEKTHNLCGLFHKSCLSFINKMLEEDIHKVGFLLKNSATKELQFEDEDEFLNMNNKDEYLKAKSIIS
ncbi:molybdenum cofactor guanylyltransferase MobA [Halarcobacter ebronensis]|uniref:Probable molybdenum cofactor guanylyltransferase n=1 Tax=Halarcobacter ebronensis TaxID=1462615 RepID=A0A4Q1AVB1_9BACT|nr:molybdenum cofactor guanylyltransferase MobA [Halarcobacter ebronensis]QKF80815.1 molybdenum cofactor guanylyltransferase protein A [Halarcobacter ebronensis]RXK08605.1 molybdenum cofactor guanylyltransferase [Halarcobacter ebronensis]